MGAAAVAAAASVGGVASDGSHVDSSIAAAHITAGLPRAAVPASQPFGAATSTPTSLAP